MQSTKLINMDLEDAKDFQCLRDRLYESLGSSFWQNHEVPKLLQWVRTVDAIHNWLEEAKEHYGRFIQQQNRETENFHLPDSYIHERFGEVYRRLNAMDPYLPRTLRNGTHYGRLEEVTRRIADELWSGNFYWLDCFSGLINAVLLDHDEWLFELIKPVCESIQPITVDQHRTVDFRCHCKWCNRVHSGRQERSRWRWFLPVLIILLVTLG
ncbi:hypothetical protein F5883DRAFT_589175 [Diaporthe sp. PMI_573]|nr:hypothetical protein F5883DRAFT_589175 [Diaporthaceae sp. PMI_573]